MTIPSLKITDPSTELGLFTESHSHEGRRLLLLAQALLLHTADT